MPNILDHVSHAPVLEINDWPRSASRKEWFAITKRIIQDTIAEMNLDPAAEAEVIESFSSSRLLLKEAGNFLCTYGFDMRNQWTHYDV